MVSRARIEVVQAIFLETLGPLESMLHELLVLKDIKENISREVVVGDHPCKCFLLILADARLGKVDPCKLQHIG